MAMKYIYMFCATVFGLMVVACGASNIKKADEANDIAETNKVEIAVNDQGFIGVGNRIYNDAPAEVDTLSYAMGMQYALSAQGLVVESGMDRELLVGSFFEMLDAETIDCDELYNTAVVVGEFNECRYMPWMSQVRRNQTLLYVNPDAEIEEPELYNKEFTCEAMTVAIGRKMAAEVRMMDVPLNRYWVEQAFDDASAIGKYMVIDSVMRLPIMGVSSIVGSKERKQSMMDYHAARTAAWLANISEQEDVVSFTKEGQETVYYRIDNDGNDRHPMDKKDSIYMEYSMYSCYGMPIESTNSMLATIDRYTARIANEPAIDEPTRIKLGADLARQREITKSGGATLESLFDVVGDCLKEIGEGGTITIWMPASHISNVALASKNLVYDGMGGVMTIHIKRVVPKAEQAPKKIQMPMHTIQGLR